MALVHRPAAVVRPDACNDLCAQTRHIGKKVHIQVQILAGHRGERCAEADQDMRSETGGTALERAFQTDKAAAENGEAQSDRDRQHGDIAYSIKNRKHFVPPFQTSSIV